MCVAQQYGGPTQLLLAQVSEPAEESHNFYRRLGAVQQFGRTGCFGFLVLLLDFDLISAEPSSLEDLGCLKQIVLARFCSFQYFAADYVHYLGQPAR